MAENATKHATEEAAGTVVVEQAPPIKKPSDPKKRPEQLPPFRVLLHNDEVNTFEHVIRSILKLTSLTLEEAIERTIEAHENGVALLLITHRERAELYADQFATVQLTVTIEPT